MLLLTHAYNAGKIAVTPITLMAWFPMVTVAKLGKGWLLHMVPEADGVRIAAPISAIRTELIITRTTGDLKEVRGKVNETC
jgi:hypothetical protein